jgi:hypothetical protein
MSSVKGDTWTSKAPATERRRCLDGSVVLVSSWWAPEVRREARVVPRDAVEITIRRALLCPPSVAAAAARDAQTWLVGLGAVVLR